MKHAINGSPQTHYGPIYVYLFSHEAIQVAEKYNMKMRTEKLDALPGNWNDIVWQSEGQKPMAVLEFEDCAMANAFVNQMDDAIKHL